MRIRDSAARSVCRREYRTHFSSDFSIRKVPLSHCGGERIKFWVDNTTHFRSFYGLFLCLRERAFIVRETKVAIIEA